MARRVISVLLVSLLVIINGTSAVRICSSTSQDWQSRIGVLISPIISGSKIRQIHLYWNNLDVEPGDRISLYVDDPSGSPDQIYTFAVESSSGTRNTTIQAEYVPSSRLSFVRNCTRYRIKWSSKKGVKRTDCLKTQPTWMKERKDILGPLRMSEIFLPGTHDSASYDVDGKKFNIITKFAVTQDLDILGQLIHGVRYLDIRVGHYPSSNEIWWTNHGPFYRSVSLKTVIDDIKKFLRNTDEILVVDMREFPVGFNSLSDHYALVSYLEDEFRDYYLPNKGWTIKLNDIWSSGKRLIIGYQNNDVVVNRASMWPSVSQQWGNVRKLDDLYKYLSTIEENDSASRVRPRSAMAELTPNANDIIFNRLGNLRDMALRVNLNVTNSYSTIWQYTANIVAVDFVRDTDIVEIAIKANENRHLHCQ